MSKKVAFLVAAEGIEQVELTEPWKAVVDSGHEAVLVSPDSGEVQMFNHLDKGDTQKVDVTVADALKKEGAEVISVARLAVGEGIEKVEEDFAAEVMKQAGLV